ncbi:hypothetical protein D3C80_1083750 [compost metagenome]
MPNVIVANGIDAAIIPALLRNSEREILLGPVGSKVSVVTISFCTVADFRLNFWVIQINSLLRSSISMNGNEKNLEKLIIKKPTIATVRKARGTIKNILIAAAAKNATLINQYKYLRNFCCFSDLFLIIALKA